MRTRYFGYAGRLRRCRLYILIFRSAWRARRITAFLNPDRDPRAHGFHIIQSLIAVGTGGLSGQGLMEGKQKLFYLPEPQTDFIFAVIAEELGLIGSVLIVLLFASSCYRGSAHGDAHAKIFARFLAVGITAMVAVQALFNISVVLGLLPTKGIPLPFISYGGSSLVHHTCQRRGAAQHHPADRLKSCA